MRDSTPLGCAIVVWLLGAALGIGFWGTVLWLGYKLVMHYIGG